MSGERIAGAEEILEMLTGIMRGEEPEAKFSERCKAAEDLGKHYGLFDAKERREGPLAAASAEIDRAIEEVKRRGTCRD